MTRPFIIERIGDKTILKKYKGSDTSVLIPAGVQVIGRYAFQYCSSIKEVTIPKSVTLIEARAFECCSNLSRITFQNPGIFVDEYAFNETPYWHRLLKEAYHCTVGSGYKPCPEELVLPEGITHVDLWAYSKSLITSAILPNSLRTIGMCAFRDCPNLREVTMSPNTTCNYKLAANPLDGIFSGCPKLEQILLRGKVKISLLEGFDTEKTFMGCTKFRRIIAWEIPLEKFPSAWKSYAINGYLSDVERSKHYLPDIASSYDNRLKEMKEQLIRRTAYDSSFAFYQYLMEHEFITSENYDSILKRVRDSENIEVIAALLDYHHRKLEPSGISSLADALDNLEL